MVTNQSPGNPAKLAQSHVTTHSARKPDVTGPPRVRILGVEITDVDMPWALDRVKQMLSEPDGRPHCIYFANADTLNLAATDPSYRDVLNGADYVFGDGTGVRWAARLQGIRLRDNVNGTDLFPGLCEALHGTGKCLYLLGARPCVAEKVRDWIATHHPDVVVAGCRHGYFTKDEEPAVIRAIADSGADLLLVAFGAPRQDLWIHEHLGDLGVRVAMGVGGLFDFYSGRVPRAPKWMRHAGLEWLYRLYQEPSRLWRRYVLGNPLFLLRVARAMGRRVSAD